MVFEYILVLSICSIVEKACSEKKFYPKPFKTHKACAIRGYEDSLNIIKSLHNDLANNKKLYTSFVCIEKEVLNA